MVYFSQETKNIRYMKSLVLFLLMAMGAVSASAQSYNYLTLQQIGGDEQSLSISGLKIIFSNGNLVATNGAQTATIPLEKMQKMYFAATATGISTAADEAAVSVSIEGGKLIVNAPKGSSVQLYGVDGRQLSPNATLNRGVYVVRVGGKSFKLLAR